MAPRTRTAQAIALLRDNPPLLEDRVTPPPIVVGDGALATEIVRRMVLGWQQPGDVLRVDAVGADDGWVAAARAGLEARSAITFTRSSLDLDAVLAVVRAQVSAWERPDPGRFAASGPTVVVALGDAAQGARVTARLAEALPDARVTAVADDPATPTLTPQSLIVDELLRDAARCPPSVPTVFGTITPDAAGRVTLAGQPPATIAALRAVGEAASSILAAGGVTVDGVGNEVSDVIVSTPAELVAMRDAIVGVLPSPAPPDRAQRALELAARLPTLASRAGWTPRRTASAPNPLDTATLRRLATLAHARYLEVSATTGNATRSSHAEKQWEELTDFERSASLAQVVDIPTKLAAVGYTWRPSDDPAPFAFDQATLELLAEWEHRRWEHHQRRNGRQGHRWAVPWEDLPDAVREYDRNAVRTVPALLAAAGWEIVV